MKKSENFREKAEVENHKHLVEKATSMSLAILVAQCSKEQADMIFDIVREKIYTILTDYTSRENPVNMLLQLIQEVDPEGYEKTIGQKVRQDIDNAIQEVRKNFFKAQFDFEQIIDEI